MPEGRSSPGYFLRELKRRRVMRTCVYYIIACWFILQVGDIVAPAVGLDSDQASRAFLYIAIFGFPLNFALAWYFQITPRGIMRTTSFVERRVLSNITPINDRRHGSVSTYFQKEISEDTNWIISAETGPLSGLSFGITDPVVVGRSLECELAVVTPHVSRRHAQFVVEDCQLYVQDMGSSNGTVVNGKTIEGRHALHHEDEIRLHDIIFRVTESYSGPRQEQDSMNQTTFIDTTLSSKAGEPKD
jgi:hypothetical protein